MRKSKYCICVILGLLVVCMLSACKSKKEIEEYSKIEQESKQIINNLYFFEDNMIEQEYEGYIYPLSSKEIRENVTLRISKLEEFQSGKLYALELKQPNVTDTEDMISMGRQYLGYFYVKDSQIYRLPVKDYAGFTEEQTQSIIKAIREDEKSFLDMCHIVCSEEVVEDTVDDQGYHSGIKADGNQRIYYFYNEDTSGTKDYEKIVWEKGKGIVYYQRGAGNMLMHIEIGVDLELYQVKKQLYVLNSDEYGSSDIEIYYPQLTGYKDEKKQERINKLILADLEVKGVSTSIDDGVRKFFGRVLVENE